MKLLIAEHPLQVLPSLAVAIGLNEAIVLQQMHYWSLMPNTLVHEGLRWIYNSMPEWQAQFPFWSEDTIARAMRSLRDRGLIEVKRLSPNPMDRRNYYAINYSKLPECIPATCGDVIPAKCGDAPPQPAGMFNKVTETTYRDSYRDSNISVRNPPLAPSPIASKPQASKPLEASPEGAGPSSHEACPPSPAVAPTSGRKAQPATPAQAASTSRANGAVLGLITAFRRARYGEGKEAPSASEIDAYTPRLRLAVKAGLKPEQLEAATHAALLTWPEGYNVNPRSMANHVPELLERAQELGFWNGKEINAECVHNLRTVGIMGANGDENDGRTSRDGRRADSGALPSSQGAGNRAYGSGGAPRHAGAGNGSAQKQSPSPAVAYLEQQLAANAF